MQRRTYATDAGFAGRGGEGAANAPVDPSQQPGQVSSQNVVGMQILENDSLTKQEAPARVFLVVGFVYVFGTTLGGTSSCGHEKLEGASCILKWPDGRVGSRIADASRWPSPQWFSIWLHGAPVVSHS